MSIAIPEHPRQSAQQSRVGFAKQFSLVDKEIWVSKSVYVRGYHRRRRKKSIALRADAFERVHPKEPSEERKDEVHQDKQEQAIRVSLKNLAAKLEEAESRRMRAFSLEFSKSFSEIQTRWESSIRDAMAIPKLTFFDFKFCQLLDVGRIQKELASNVVGAIASSHYGAMRDALSVQSRLAEISRAVNYRSSALDKLSDTQRVFQESVSLAIAEILNKHRSAIDEAVQAQLRIADTEAELSGPDFSNLLDAIRKGKEAPSSEALEAIVEIQASPIPEDLLQETILILLEFIQKHRGTNSQKVLIAVSAAIRKVLLNLPGEEIGLASELLKAEGSLNIPIELELEVAKMVVHRFRYAPDTDSSSMSKLAELLQNNAILYVQPNLINREKCGATALNSFLAVLLMRHPDSSELSEKICQTAPTWFLDSVRSRLRRLLAELAKQEGASFSDLAQWIESLPIMAMPKEKH